MLTDIIVVGFHEEALWNGDLFQQSLGLFAKPGALTNYVFHFLPVLFFIFDYFQSLVLQFLDVDVSFFFIFEGLELSL